MFFFWQPERDWLAYPYQCYSVNNRGYDKKQHGCMMCLKWVAGVLIFGLEEIKHQYNDKAKSSMNWGGGINFFRVATNREKKKKKKKHRIGWELV